jgi:hypothetical protein
MSDKDVFQRHTVAVRNIFGDLPIVEAKADFVVYVSADEHQTGVRGDPNNCMFSQACKRAFGSKGVLFFPTVAYVDMLDPDDSSRRIVMRFVLPIKTREKLEAFDMDADERIESTFILKAVPKTRQLAHMKKYAAQHKIRAEVSDEVIAARKVAAAKGQKTRRDKRLMGVRSGTGQVLPTHA